MSWKRYLIIMLMLAIIATTFLFRGQFTEWLNTCESLLLSSSISEYHVAIVGFLICIIGLVIPRSSVRFVMGSWGILAFGSFILLFALLAVDALIVWASLALAIAAIFSFRESRQLRRDNVKREERDRQERWLDEVIIWADGFANVSFGHTQQYDDLRAGKEARAIIIGLGNKIFRYQAIDTKSPHIEKIAEYFGVELHTAVLEVMKCRHSVSSCLDEIMRDPLNKSLSDNLNNYELELRNKAVEVIRSATNIKISLVK